MAILVDLHFVAGAHPAAELRFRLLILIKIAGAQRLAQLVDMSGKPKHH